jgi:hypothetical protein
LHFSKASSHALRPTGAVSAVLSQRDAAITRTRWRLLELALEHDFTACKLTTCFLALTNSPRTPRGATYGARVMYVRIVEQSARLFSSGSAAKSLAA